MDERARERQVIDLSVSCRGFRGDEQILIFNLSTSGCMIFSQRQSRLTPGETLLISLIGGVEVAGQIVWERASYAGVQFTSELPERIVALLGFNNRIRRWAGEAAEGSAA